jgi:hypothetical protein
MANETPWSITYHDGSGNRYRFWRDDDARFEYEPVTPEMSSSGTYSGGEPRAGELTVEQTRELWRRIKSLRAATALHTETRAMGTGAFVVVTDDGTDRFLIRGGAELREFDAAVAAFREPPR